MKNVLITGGSGLLGTRLTEILITKGYEVSFLSRGGKGIQGVKVYKWDIDSMQIEEEAVKNADCIVHLAGAGVADKRWTQKRKKEIRESRTKSSKLIIDAIKQFNYSGALISASAIGYYGFDTGEVLLKESAQAGNDFLAEVTKDWETSIEETLKLGIRTVVFRIGVVLSYRGGALPKLTAPIKVGLGAALGSGNQYISWIHIDDLCNIFIKAIEDQSIEGIYNAVAPNPVSNEEITRAIAKAYKKKVFLPNIPSFVLKVFLGEMAQIILGGNNVSCKKILDTGFSFKYRTVETALKDLIPSV